MESGDKPALGGCYKFLAFCTFFMATWAFIGTVIIYEDNRGYDIMQKSDLERITEDVSGVEKNNTYILVKTGGNSDGHSLRWIPSVPKGFAQYKCDTNTECGDVDGTLISSSANYEVFPFANALYTRESHDEHVYPDLAQDAIHFTSTGRAHIFAVVSMQSDNALGLASGLISIVRNGGYAAPNLNTSPTLLGASATQTLAQNTAGTFLVDVTVDVAAGDYVRLGFGDGAGSKDVQVQSLLFRADYV